MNKVVLDAGHYAYYNHSPVVPAYWESKRMWTLHLMLKEELEKYGIEVGLTRENQETDLELTKRGEKAKGYDLFLSLHSNSATSEAVDYVAIMQDVNNANNARDFSKRIAEVVRELMGCSHVNIFQRAFDDDHPKLNYYGVLRGAARTDCPLYLIIEHGFHSNKRNAEWLMSDDNLRLMAQAEAKCIADYFGINIRVGEYIKGLNVGTTTKEALDILRRMGYNADSPAPADKVIATGDGIYIDGTARYIVTDGDVNGDGVVDNNDAQLVKRHVIGTKRLTGAYLVAADLNGDGKVNATDYLILRRKLLKGALK